MASRIHFSTGWSRMIPAPPRTWTASVVILHRGVGGERLRVGAEQAGILALVDAAAARQTSNLAASIEHGHVGELEADALPAEDRASKRLPLARVLRRVLEGGARDADCACGHLWARGLKEVECDLEALSFVSEPPLDRNTGAVEHERSRVRRTQSDLALDAAR